MKKLKFFLLPLLLLTFLAGCGNNAEKEEVSEVVKSYIDYTTKGEWEKAIVASTGEQLSVLMLLSDQLELTQYDGTVRLANIVSVTADEEQAKAIVHVVRDLKVQDYGTLTDDRQIAYSLYNVDGEWKVYKVEVVLDYNQE